MAERRSRRAALALVLGGLLPAYLAVVAPPAHGANLVVTSPLASGAGSLSQAVFLAAPGDTITFSSALNGVPIQTPEDGYLINKNLTIRGNGANFTIIHGALPKFARVFDISNGTVVIDGLTITSAEANFSAVAINVFPGANLTLSRSRITGTRSGPTGAFRNEGRATIRNTVIDSNQALTCAGVTNAGSQRLTVIDSLITNNTATDGFGGGICNTGSGPLSEVELLNTDVVGNHATKPPGDSAFGLGGGIAVSSGGGMTMRDGAIRSNRVTSGGAGSTSRGGGLYSEGDFAFLARVEVSANELIGPGSLLGGGIMSFGKNLIIVDSTLTANSAGSDRGGAIYNVGPATLTNATLAQNQAGVGSNIYNIHTIKVSGTIMANSPSSMCAGPGSFDDEGHNISFPDATCPGAVVDPLLGPLAFNGGPTQTMALQPGSPAIDPGALACFPQDQRGFPRNVGPCDIGAYEFGATLNDVTAPSCAITALRADNPRQMDVTVQDTSSGLNTVVPTLQQNAVINVPYFQKGTRNPVVVTAAKVDQAQIARWAFEATDLQGNSRLCT